MSPCDFILELIRFAWTEGINKLFSRCPQYTIEMTLGFKPIEVVQKQKAVWSVVIGFSGGQQKRESFVNCWFPWYYVASPTGFEPVSPAWKANFERTLHDFKSVYVHWGPLMWFKSRNNQIQQIHRTSWLFLSTREMPKNDSVPFFVKLNILGPRPQFFICASLKNEIFLICRNALGVDF